MKNTLLRLVFAVVALTAGLAQADVLDRINSCEQSGGGACLYDILRELAADKPHGPGSCSGYSHTGACWFRADLGESCQAHCARLGFSYDHRTVRADNNAVCATIATALGGKGNGSVNGQMSCGGAEDGTGCGYWPGGAASMFWCGTARGDAKSSSVARMCACQ